MDFWGDAGQVCIAGGALLGGGAAVFAATYGRKLWQVTDGLKKATVNLSNQTFVVSEETRRLANETHELARQTLRANSAVEAEAEWRRYQEMQPKFSVMIDYEQGDGAFLYVRHLPESPMEIVETLSPRIGEAFDRGLEGEDRSIQGPWRFAAGADGAERKWGRTVEAREDLKRGAATRWALEKVFTGPWLGGDNDPEVSEPCLIDLTATAGEREWSYSVLITAPRREFRL